MINIKKERVLITPKDIKPSSKKFEVLGTCNPGATRLPNGNIMLYVRVIEKLIKNENKKYCYSPRFVGENRFRIKLDKFDKKLISDKSNLGFTLNDGTKRLSFISHLRRVVLDKTGFKIKSINKNPNFFGLSWDGELSVEDPRITKINDLYVMTYVSLSRENNISTSYALSNDCINWYRRGIIFREQNKDVVIFPQIINNSYYAFDRPEGTFQFSPPHIWISHSKDLEFWGEPESIILSKKKDYDYGKNGAGPPPIKTKRGWLLLYHTILKYKKFKKLITKDIQKILESKDKNLEEKTIYSVGAALFNLKNPRKLIAKSKFPIIIPIRKCEMRTFEDKKIVFPTGIVIGENNKDLLIFSGGGDSTTTVKKVVLNDILKTLKKVK